MNIWFTSDWHWNHVNIAGPSVTKWDKGFRNFNSVEEMNEVIIGNHNSLVKSEDVVYNLGDVIMGSKPVLHLPKLMDRLNGKIHLLFGNHDHIIRKTPDLECLFQDTQDYKEVRIGGYLFVLCHYLFGTWNEIGRGSINLGGHSHGTYTRTIGRQMDVGVDTNNFYPYHIDEIIERMSKIDPAQVDHHSGATSYH
jgi:calcineurin-like phosphoesterase family protein